MQKLSDIKQVIKQLEKSILEDIELPQNAGFYLPIKDDLESYIVARKVLLWVILSQPRKKKDTKSAKLEDYGLENPLLKVIPNEPKKPVEMFTTDT